MKKARLDRLFGTDKQTLGTLSTINNGQIWTAKTLELPNKGNQSQISCVPAGIYLCKFTFSPGFKKNTYELQNVPGRKYIRIHAANFVGQLLGCIALGDAHKDINNDGLQDTIHSGTTIDEFENIMAGEDFELEIRDAYLST